MNVALEAVVGSKAYGLDTPASDEDLLGVFVAPTEHIVGLGWNAHRATVVSQKPDVTHHEIGKFCSLALKANPTVTELLWVEPLTRLTSVGVALRDHREAFLSTTAVRNAYGGYARSQFERLIRRGDTFSSATAKRTAKHARHCVRLLWQGQELLTTGRLTVRLTRDESLTCVALGNMAADDVDNFKECFDTLDLALRSVRSVLPDTPDFEAINQLVVDIRRDNWSAP